MCGSVAVDCVSRLYMYIQKIYTSGNYITICSAVGGEPELLLILLLLHLIPVVVDFNPRK